MSEVRIADLRARLSEHLRSVRNGGTVTVLDRDTPVAQIIPFVGPSLDVRKTNRPRRDLKLPRKPARRTDNVALLLEDRISVEKRADHRSAAKHVALTMEEAAERIAVVNEWLEGVDLVLLRPPVLGRANEPMPMLIGTLDAIHLATALIWRDHLGPFPQDGDARCGAWRRRACLRLRRSRHLTGTLPALFTIIRHVVFKAIGG